jgi:hypothetical protein
MTSAANPAAVHSEERAKTRVVSLVDVLCEAGSE